MESKCTTSTIIDRILCFVGGTLNPTFYWQRLDEHVIKDPRVALHNLRAMAEQGCVEVRFGEEEYAINDDQNDDDIENETTDKCGELMLYRNLQFLKRADKLCKDILEMFKSFP